MAHWMCKTSFESVSLHLVAEYLPALVLSCWRYYFLLFTKRYIIWLFVIVTRMHDKKTLLAGNTALSTFNRIAPSFRVHKFSDVYEPKGLNSQHSRKTSVRREVQFFFPSMRSFQVGRGISESRPMLACLLQSWLVYVVRISGVGSISGVRLLPWRLDWEVAASFLPHQ